MDRGGAGGNFSGPGGLSAGGAGGVALTPYLDPMPTLVDNAIDAIGGGTVKLTTALISRKVHRQLPATTLFGYLHSGGPGPDDTRASYLGPAIVAKSGTAVKVRYVNGRPRTIPCGRSPTAAPATCSSRRSPRSGS
jgi:hypothetical protein